MKSTLNRTIFLSSALVLLTACSAKVPHYNSSADNVLSLRALNVSINVGSIKATNPQKSIMCRLANPVEMPNGKTINEYIESAFIEEIKMAGFYDISARITISGNLNEVSASSGMTDGHWLFDMSVMSTNGKSFNVVSKHEFAGSFSGVVACREDMPDEFQPAVQKLIKNIVTHSKFKSLLI
ncbi:MAG: hypothetical protein LPH21_13990 [Shewanella sp.]|nr:hypothetical protein [Shewanella sp.]MCF1458612.1 hypothetical protein [Shewanella sp.]